MMSPRRRRVRLAAIRASVCGRKLAEMASTLPRVRVRALLKDRSREPREVRPGVTSDMQEIAIDTATLTEIVRNEVRAAVRELLFSPAIHPRHVDYERMAYMAAAAQSAELMVSSMQTATDLVTNQGVREHALGQCEVEGLVMEFGVRAGGTLTHMASLAADQEVHGFDSFEGLPEDWTYFQKKGRYTLGGEPPRIDLPNVTLHKGWFSDSLPPFLATHPGPARFVHFVCDLYSSTDTVLRALEDRLVPGTVIVFDEYVNYPGWQEHEYKAFNEFLTRTGARFRYLGFASGQCAVSVRIE
jgi:hypothetical protein